MHQERKLEGKKNQRKRKKHITYPTLPLYVHKNYTSYTQRKVAKRQRCVWDVRLLPFPFLAKNGHADTRPFAKPNGQHDSRSLIQPIRKTQFLRFTSAFFVFACLSRNTPAHLSRFVQIQIDPEIANAAIHSKKKKKKCNFHVSLHVRAFPLLSSNIFGALSFQANVFRSGTHSLLGSDASLLTSLMPKNYACPPVASAQCSGTLPSHPKNVVLTFF